LLADNVVLSQCVPAPVTVTAAGGVFIVTELELTAVPPEVVTLTVPVVPDPTTTTTVVALLEVILETAVPPTETAVGELKLVPVMVKVPPSQIVAKSIEEIVGVAGTV
jgi:hypothetical protein